MFPISRFLRRAGLPLLALTLTSQPLAAQPDDTPRTIKSPQNFPVGAPAVVPDPPVITLAELQNLIGGPTLISFSGQDVPLADVVKVIQDGARMPAEVLNTRQKQPLSVDWEDVPFWTAAQEVEKQTGERWDPRLGEGMTLSNAQFRQRTTGEAPRFGLNGRVGADTPFVKIIADSISRSSSRTMRLGAAEGPLKAEPASTQLTLTTYFDPKLGVQSASLRELKFQPQSTRIIAGRAGYHFGNFGIGGRSNLSSPFTVSLPAELRSGTMLASISGTLHTVLISASQPWKVPDVVATPKATQTAGESRYSLESAELRADRLTLSVSALVPPTQGQAIGGFRPFGNLRVRDAQGRDLMPMGSSSRRTTEGGKAKYAGEFSFRLRSVKDEPLEGPFSLDWPLITEVRSLDVPFELRDVPVP